MHEALYYRTSQSAIICELCPHMCRLADGETGRCRTRINKEGKLYTMAYANPCAVHIDPVEKKPLYHFLPSTHTFSIATAGCNLTCLNCQNSSISQNGPGQVPDSQLLPKEVIELALLQGCKSISYTYTDPTVYYEYMLDTAQLAHASNLRNIMVSAGYINPKPLERLIQFIDGANIDLKCFDDAIYQRLSGIRLKPVLNTLLTLKKKEVWLEITNLVIPGYTDDLKMIGQMLDWLIEHDFEAVPIHFNRFVPAHQLAHLSATPQDLLFEIAELAIRKGMHYVYIGNVGPNRHQHTHCHHCGTEVIKREYYHVDLSMSDNGGCPVCHAPIEGVWH